MKDNDPHQRIFLYSEKELAKYYHYLERLSETHARKDSCSFHPGGLVISLNSLVLQYYIDMILHSTCQYPPQRCSRLLERKRHEVLGSLLVLRLVSMVCK